MNESDPLMQSLADANPAPLDEVEGANRTASATRLLDGLTRRHHRALIGRGRALGRARWVLVAAALVALGAVGLILREATQAPATAAELLRRTAAVAADLHGPPGEGRYSYTKILTDQLTTSGESDQAWSVILPTVEETWIGADGSGRIRSMIGEARFPGPRDRERWLAAGSPPLPSGVSDETFPPGVLAYEDLRSLPTEPRELLAVLQRQVATEDLPTDVAVFVRVGQLLAPGDAPSELRAALYVVASRLAGVELIGEVVDPLGRPGLAVAMTHSELGSTLREVMIFDGETSALLAHSQVLLEPAPWIDAVPGARISFTAYLEAGRTASVRVTPDLDHS